MTQTPTSMPQPQERQRVVLTCPCDEILYGGAAGAGKTFALLLDYQNHAIAAEASGKKSSGVLFRKTFRELEDLVRESREMYDPLGWKFSKDRMEWTSPHGSILRLSFLASMDDAYGHRGFEYDWIGRDELTLWNTDEEYEYLNSRLRSSSGVKCRQVSTTNPGGPGHSWVMRRFKIDKYPNGLTPLVTTVKLADGREIKRTRIFIPGKLRDNIYLSSDGQYEANLRTNPPHIQKMLLDGRWDIIEGAFFNEWDPMFHVCQPFLIPDEWTRWIAMDWGSVHPYCVLWFAQSPHGEIYIYRELYGDGSERFGGKSNVGTRESGEEVGRKILALEETAGELIRERYADSQIWQNMGHQFTIGDAFRTAGVVFLSAAKLNKAHSINLLRNTMKIVNGYTQLKIFTNCTNLIKAIPSAIISSSDPSVYDPKGETHALDALLYGLRKNTNPESLNLASKAIKINAQRASRYGAYGVQ